MTEREEYLLQIVGLEHALAAARTDAENAHRLVAKCTEENRALRAENIRLVSERDAAASSAVLVEREPSTCDDLLHARMERTYGGKVSR